MSPGYCLSVIKLEYSTPGFIAKPKGIPTQQRYHAATISMIHYSDISYVYLKKSYLWWGGLIQ